MWEINEGDIKFLYAMKLMPPVDLGNIVHLGSIHRILVMKELFLETTGIIILAHFIDNHVFDFFSFFI